MNSDSKNVYIYGWRCSTYVSINKTDTIKSVRYGIENFIGIPNKSYLWINRSPITRENNIKLMDENKPLFDYGLIDGDIITVVSPIIIMINNIEVSSIYIDSLDSVCDLRHGLFVMGVVDRSYLFTLKSDHIEFCSKYSILSNMFNNLNLRVYIEYGKKITIKRNSCAK